MSRPSNFYNVGPPTNSNNNQVSKGITSPAAPAAPASPAAPAAPAAPSKTEKVKSSLSTMGHATANVVKDTTAKVSSGFKSFVQYPEDTPPYIRKLSTFVLISIMTIMIVLMIIIYLITISLFDGKVTNNDGKLPICSATSK